jgi:zinc protease
MDSPVTKEKLSNGLQILLKEIHNAPLISHWMWYRVGSRDDTTKKSGISHWVEHMQFKGTPLYPSGALDKAIAREGGFWNALTYLDWTTYFETLPASKIELAVRLEADRLSNSLMNHIDVESERKVIISERLGNQNEPLFKLGEKIQSALFRTHPYSHVVIGKLFDLESITRDDLVNHYHTFYIPNNAVLTIAGDFETENMLNLILKYFDRIPPGEIPERHIHQEPAQIMEHHFLLEEPGDTTYLQASYRAPSASQADFFPMAVLDSLLTGPSSLNMFGGGISNKTSRLYLALVEQELAIGISGSMQATIEPFIYSIICILHPKANPEQVIRVIDREIERILVSPPRPEELKRAVKQARALFAYGSESVTNQAYWLGFAEMFDSYKWFVNYLDNLASVTVEDIQRIAHSYLTPERRVLGIFKPA